MGRFPLLHHTLATTLPTLELVDLLVAHNPGYWGEDSPYGKRLTETRLGRMLNQATNSTSMRPGGKGHRGYTLSALQIAWDRLRVGQTDPDATSINPVSLENPANPERESARPEPDNAGLTEFSGCTGLQERGAGFDEAPPPSEDPIAGYDPDKSVDARFAALRAKLRLLREAKEAAEAIHISPSTGLFSAGPDHTHNSYPPGFVGDMSSAGLFLPIPGPKMR